MNRERNTKQKILILNAVRCSCVHPTAEQIYGAVRNEMAGISLGTVYRNLKRLADSGEIKRICVPDAPDRFDRTLHEHNHISCLGCGAFDDIGIPYDASLDSVIGDESGYEVEKHETVFYGYCPKCRVADMEKQSK